MRQFIISLVILAGFVTPFIAMPLLWRRMKRVRDDVYREAQTHPGEQPWEEKVDEQHGLNLVRTSKPNDDLIGLGEKARHSRWPLDNP